MQLKLQAAEQGWPDSLVPGEPLIKDPDRGTGTLSCKDQCLKGYNSRQPFIEFSTVVMHLSTRDGATH